MSITHTNINVDSLRMRVFEVEIGGITNKVNVSIEYNLPLLISSESRLDTYTIDKVTTQFTTVGNLGLTISDPIYTKEHSTERFKILGLVRSYNGGEQLAIYDKKYKDIFMCLSFIDYSIAKLNIDTICYNGYKLGFSDDVLWTSMLFKGVVDKSYRELPEIKAEKKDLVCRIANFPDIVGINQGGVNTLEKEVNGSNLQMGLYGHTPIIDFGKIGDIFPDDKKLPLHLICQNGPASFGLLYSGLLNSSDVKDLHLCIYSRF